MIHTLKKCFVSAICVMVAISATSQVASHSVASPDGNLKLSFSLTDEGVPTYKIDYKDIPVVKTSRLGMELNEENSLMDKFRINKVSTSSFDETWQPVWGEESNIRNLYNELFVELEKPSY